MCSTHYHADHVGGDIFGQHIQGLVDLLELADVPVHVQKDEVPWVAEMTGAPVASLVPHATTMSCRRVPSACASCTLPATPPVANASWSRTTCHRDTLFIDGCGRTDLPGPTPLRCTPACSAWPACRAGSSMAGPPLLARLLSSARGREADQLRSGPDEPGGLAAGLYLKVSRSVDARRSTRCPARPFGLATPCSKVFWLR